MIAEEPSPSLNFISDNCAGAAPEVIAALTEANKGLVLPYGNDDISRLVERIFADIFEKEVRVFLVGSGTAANALGLSLLTPPWGSVLCHSGSHIKNDECGATMFFTFGANLVSVHSGDSKISIEQVRHYAASGAGDVHSVQPACVSVSQPTERGEIYSCEDLQALGSECRRHKLALHMDGARFSNALVSIGVSPAELTWRAGVDVLSFGTIKNGTMCADAVVLFDTSRAEELAFRRKRGGSTFGG
jgi:threonine aldolase